MAKSNVSFILILFLKFLYVTMEDAGTLELSHVIYRHGDRTPVSIYPNDPYNETYWPQGLGQLTKLGKTMEYNLGKWLRKRYSKFIASNFNSEEVHVRSTDVDRTLMSAQCVLAALFCPDESTKFNQSLLWMPTPVHTIPEKYDMLLNVRTACPRISKERQLLKRIPEFKSYMSKHKQLFKYLSEHSGHTIDNLTFTDYLYDTLKIERLYNLTLPDWTNGYMGKMKKVTDFSFKADTYTMELKRLTSGPLIGEIRDHMDGKMKNSNDLSAKKLFMYSAHDTTVAALLNSLGIFNDLLPPYAATVLIELYQREGSYFVKTFYQNDSSMIAKPHLLIIPGCNSICPLHSWKHLVEPVIPDYWASECNIPDHHRDLLYINFLSGTVLLLLFTLLLTAIMYCFYKKKYGRGSETYLPIPSEG